MTSLMASLLLLQAVWGDIDEKRVINNHNDDVEEPGEGFQIKCFVAAIFF